MTSKVYSVLALSLSSMLLYAMNTSADSETSTLNAIVDTGISRTAEGVKAQQKINAIDQQRKDLEAEFVYLTKTVNDTHIYNRVLEKQVQQQQQEMEQLQQGIKNAAEMERQLIPLQMRMVQALSAFIEMDVPFLITERRFRADELGKLISRSDVTIAEKMRRVLQAYQIEMDYGRTIEAYRDQIEVDGNLVEADFLRIGRVSLMYQTLDGTKAGAWHHNASVWKNIPTQRFKQNLKQGLKIARKQTAPAMLLSPVFKVETAQGEQSQ